jgi:hypothetical protein
VEHLLIFHKAPCDDLVFFPLLECTKILGANVRSIFEEEVVTKPDPPDESKLFEEDDESSYDV